MMVKKYKRKIRAAAVLLILTVILAGCRSEKTEKEVPSEKNQAKTENEEDDKSCFILEDETYIYVCGAYNLLKIDKVTGKSEALWSSEENLNTVSFYCKGEGLLINDKIYFIEYFKGEAAGTEHKALSVVNTDGTDYKRIREMEGYSPDSLVIVDGVLYGEEYKGEQSRIFAYQVYKDGTLKELAEREIARKMPDGYEMIYYDDNGRRKLFVPEAEKNFGYLLLRDPDYNLVKVNPVTGEEEELPKEFENLGAYNERYFLSNLNHALYLFDRETLSLNKTIKYDDVVNSSIYIITMDKEYVYVEYTMESEERDKYVYEKISLDTCDRSVIFEQEFTGIGNWEPLLLANIVVKNGYLYYVGESDYKLYLMRRSLENPSEEEVLGEAFYDSGVSEVGTVQFFYEKVYGREEPDILLTETDLAWLQVDERFAGADEINRYLAEQQKQNIEYEKDNLEWLEESLAEYGRDGIYHYSYSSKPLEIAYFDEHYLSFCQWEYDYMGGAHGLPIWLGETFDLQTGQKLCLQDVIGNSEEELKDIVTEYFAEFINQDPESFWADASETVREETNFESDFYLTQDGIKFYFHPYVLACYAAGFQETVIPYDEFEMKIALKKCGETNEK